MNKKLMVDVSSHNRNLCFDKLEKDNIKNIIFRAGYGDERDSYLDKNIKKAIEKDFGIGMYWAVYCIDEKSLLENARSFYDVIKEYESYLTLPVFIDWEYFTDNYAKKYGRYFSVEERTFLVNKFLSYLEDKGLYVGVYANVDYIENKFNYEKLKKYDLWIADWRDTPNNKWLNISTIWQYTESGKKYGDGIDTTDLNYVLVDYNEIFKENNFGRYKNIKNVKNKKEISKNDNLKIGDFVKIKKGAKSFNDVKLLDFVYENVYRVDYIKNNRIVLDKNGINTPIHRNDLVKVKRNLKVGDMVKIKNGSDSYDGVGLYSFVYKKWYRVDSIDGDRVLLDKNGINTPIHKKDLIIG